MSKSLWKRKKIGDLFDVQLGKMFNEKAKQGKLYPYLANFNVRWGSFDLSRLNEMSFSEREKEKCSLRVGDLLMCEGGEIGRCAVWNGLNKAIYYQKALHRLRPLNRDITTEFLYYYMQFIVTKGELPKLVAETSIAHLTKEKLLSFLIPVPPRKEQNQIVSLLSTWDEAIEKTEELFKAKETQFKHLLDKLINQGSMKSAWRKMKLEEAGWISSAGVDKKSNANEKPVRLVNYLDVLKRDFIYPADLTHWVTAPVRQIENCSVRQGDIFFTPSSEIRGDIAHSAVAMEDIKDGVYSYHIIRFRLNENWDINFRAYALKSPHFYKQAYRLCEGSGQRYVISQRYFREMTIFVPPIEEQRRIGSILDSTQQEINLLKKKVELYRKQKCGLMQKLLTSEWRLKTFNQ